tara:strand:+ start:131 stop:988 length:858 start_codon:yes stop_codon:yes gene_type:complete
MSRSKKDIATDKINNYIGGLFRDMSDMDILLTPEIAKIFAKSQVTSNFHVGDINQGNEESDLFDIIKNKKETVTSRVGVTKYDVDLDKSDCQIDTIQTCLTSLKHDLIYDNGLIVNKKYKREVMLTYVARHLFYMIKEGVCHTINTTGCNGYIMAFQKVSDVFNEFNYRTMRKMTNDMGISYGGNKPSLDSILLSNKRGYDREEAQKSVEAFIDDFYYLVGWVSTFAFTDRMSVEFNLISSDFYDNDVETDFDYLLGSRNHLNWVYKPQYKRFNIGDHLNLTNYR